MSRERTVSSTLFLIGVTLLILAMSPRVQAQGVQLSVGPQFLLGGDMSGVPGLPVGSIGLSGSFSYHTVVEDDGFISYMLSYNSMPYDTDSILSLLEAPDGTTLEISTRKSLTFGTALRFRFGYDLDEIAPLLMFHGGLGLQFGGDGKIEYQDVVTDQDYGPSIPFLLGFGAGIGLEYPLNGEEAWALVAILHPMFELTFSDIGSESGANFKATGIALTVGIEYRDD